jgi:hypothetical protein
MFLGGAGCFGVARYGGLRIPVCLAASGNVCDGSVTCMPCVVCYPLPRPTPPHPAPPPPGGWCSVASDADLVPVPHPWLGEAHSVPGNVRAGTTFTTRIVSHCIALRLHPHTISVCAAASARMFMSQQYSRPLLQRLLPPIFSCAPLAVDCVPRVRHTYACTVFLMRVCRARAPCSGTTLSPVTWRRSCFPA